MAKANIDAKIAIKQMDIGAKGQEQAVQQTETQSLSAQISQLANVMKEREQFRGQVQKMVVDWMKRNGSQDIRQKLGDD